MDTRIIIIILMAIALFVWVIFCDIQFIRHSKDVVVGVNFIGHVECEICKTKYDVSAEEFTKSYVGKSRSTTKTKAKIGMLINRPSYRYYAKKFYCPHCKKKRYAQVLNINEINNMSLKPVLKTGLQWLLIMFIGGLLILTIARIPMHFANNTVEKRVEEMRQQQYKELKERYLP